MTGLLILFFVFSCAKKPSAPKAGSASAEDMLSLLPKDSKAVFFADLHKVMSVETIDKTIKENKDYQKYQEFVEKTGIDPQKDIYLIAGALTEGIGPQKQEGVVLVNLKYDKDSLLSIMKEQGEVKEEELETEEYNGITLYNVLKEGEEGCFSFLDSSNIALGKVNEVKSVIDIMQKKAENVFKNEELANLIKTTNKEAMFWGVISIPPEVVSQVAAKNPMLQSLEGLKSLSMYFDYKNTNIIAEIKAISTDPDKNKQIAELLNGAKAMGAMASAKEPAVGELMNNIVITSGEDHVKIYASIPEELINKLKEKKMKKEEEEN